MTLGKRLYWIIALVAVLALAGAGVTLASGITSARGGDDDGEEQANAGQVDDGKDLLPQASITVDQAIAAAQGAAGGDIGEIDLEYYNGKLVFNVDVGDQDVKVDASDGTVLGSGHD